MILAGALVLVGADQAYRHVGGDGVDAGVLDETAHLMTGFLLLAAVFRGAPRAFAAGLLVASVAIDADHIPQHLGTDIITAGTARPYSHSLLTVAVLLVLALHPRWRLVLLGAAIGILGHFGRDMAENDAGVSLLWPFSDHSYTAPPAVYFGVVALLAAVALWRSIRAAAARLGDRPRLETPGDADAHGAGSPPDPQPAAEPVGPG